jgi:hypothetical protein
MAEIGGKVNRILVMTPVFFVVISVFVFSPFVVQNSALAQHQKYETDAVPGISSQDIERGWYYGSLIRKKPGTPDDWVHDAEGTRSACWHKPGVRCGQGPNKRQCARANEMCGGIAGILCCPGLNCKLAGSYPDANGICDESAEQGNKHP